MSRFSENAVLQSDAAAPRRVNKSDAPKKTVRFKTDLKEPKKELMCVF